MVRESEFKSEDPGFEPLAGQGEGQFIFCLSESTLVQTCLCLTPPFMYVYDTRSDLFVKDLISICRKRVGLTAGGMKTRKDYTREDKRGESW